MTRRRSVDEVRFRDAAPEDADLVADLARRTFSDAFAHLNDPDDFGAYLDGAFSPQQISSELNDPRATFLLGLLKSVSEADSPLRPFVDAPFGYCKLVRHSTLDCVPGERPIELQRIYLEQVCRGSGLGSLLMVEALERARAGGHDWIWLCSWEENHAANRFYREHGFQVVGERDFVMGRDRQRDRVLAREL